MNIAILVILAAVAAVVILKPTWRIARYVVTAMHETGHVMAALLTGGHVQKIRLNFDTSGDTLYKGDKSRIRRGFIAGAGYVSPPLAGLGLSWAVHNGHASSVDIALAVWLVILVLFTRNLFGILFVAVFLGAAWLSWNFDFLGVSEPAITGLFMYGGLRAAVEQVQSKPAKRDGSDAGAIADTLFIPAKIAAGLQVVVAFACCAVGTWWMLQ